MRAASFSKPRPPLPSGPYLVIGLARSGVAAAEVFGSYSRGRRMHAIACRIERVTAGRWQVVALHIG